LRFALFIASAAAALGAAPAMADEGQRFDWNAQLQAYPTARPLYDRQCFNGKFIVGANRSGASTLYVQAAQGGIYQVKLGGSCSALSSADKITLRSPGSDDVCDRQSADLVVHTSAGAKRCHASDVRRLTSNEVVALSRAPQR
jgi:hypothetical protein